MHPFNSPDVWSGGSVEALMCFDACDHPTTVDIARAIWSFPSLDGPYSSNDIAPQQQKPFDLTDFVNSGCLRMYGMMTYQDGASSPVSQYTVSTDNGLWIYFGPTIGGLPAQWNVGAYPFDDGLPTKWLSPLIDRLRELTDHVHQHGPLLGAIYGVLDPSDCDLLLNAIAGNVPDKRWNSIAVYEGTVRHDFPSTKNEPPMTIDD